MKQVAVAEFDIEMLEKLITEYCHSSQWRAEAFLQLHMFTQWCKEQAEQPKVKEAFSAKKATKKVAVKKGKK